MNASTASARGWLIVVVCMALMATMLLSDNYISPPATTTSPHLNRSS